MITRCDNTLVAKMRKVHEADAAHERMMQEIAALAGVKRKELREHHIDAVVAKHGKFPKEHNK